MDFSTTTLDVFDDQGALLLRHFPDRETLPDIVKTAEATDPEDHQDADFALIFGISGGHRERRFLTASPGHTALSVMYFGETRGSLPLEAEKVAAARLAQACRVHGMRVPSLLIEMASGVDDLSPYVFLDDDDDGPTKLAEAPSASSFALDGAFPLNSAQEIKAAVRYFAEYSSRFAPEDRHEFASNVVAAAEDVGMRVPAEMSKVAGLDLDPGWAGHVLTRRHILKERGAPQAALDALEKVASAAGHVPALEFVQALTHFDRRTGLHESWGRELYDPYASCLTKTAAEVERIDQSGGPREYRVDEVTAEDLEAATGNGSTMAQIRNLFGDTFGDRFMADPVKAYASTSGRLRTLLTRVMSRDGSR